MKRHNHAQCDVYGECHYCTKPVIVWYTCQHDECRTVQHLPVPADRFVGDVAHVECWNNAQKGN